MKLVNEKVLHKKFGEGIVIKFENEYVTIKFNCGDKKFLYPDSIVQGFLNCENQVVINDATVKMQLKNDEKNRQKRLIEEERLQQKKIEEEQKIVEKKKYQKVNRENIAFKCTYCDGGSNDRKIGFLGPCSREIIEYNVNKEKHVWCSLGSKCGEFLKGAITFEEVEKEFEEGELCYESTMLKRWVAGAGVVQTGVNKGRPMQLKKVQTNSLAVLTTRFPWAKEEERVIFAVFLVDEAYEGDNRECGFVTTSSNWKIELKPQEAKQMLFWNYYFCSNAQDVIRFGSGLHRYLSDIQAAQILKDIVQVKTDEKEKIFAEEFLSEFCTRVGLDKNDIGPNEGALLRKN